MPTTRRNTFRLLVLTLAVGLIALALVALACAPSAPGEQEGTPEPTSSADPTHTPTPTWQAELSTVTHAVVVKQATIAAASSGATGQSASERPATIRVNIYTADIETRSRIEQFLASNSGTVLHSIPTNPDGLTDFEAVVPVSLLDSLSKQTGVLLIDTIEKYYEKLDKELDSIVSQYDAGLITEQEAVTLSYLPYWEGKVLIVADFDTSANAHSALRYLKSNDVYMMSHPVETMVIAGFVPVSLLLPLSQQPGAIIVNGYGYGADLSDPGVQEELDMYKPPEDQPTGGATGQQGGISTATPTPQPTVASAAIALHGANDWQGAGIEGMDDSGNRMKIGVIDVGFNGYNQMAGKGELPPLTGVNAVKARCYNSLGFHTIGTYACQSRLLGINHGTAVAEAAIDIAPGASLFISNPSIPYLGQDYRHGQLKETIEWLIAEGVDVIIHSRGWPFEGAGDGTAYADGSYSPLTAIDTAVSGVIWESNGNLRRDANGSIINNPIVWVNAAGNQARGTRFARREGIANPSGQPTARSYALTSANLVRFNGTTGTDDCNRIQYSSSVDLKSGTKFYYHLRWGGNASSNKDANELNLDFGLYEKNVRIHGQIIEKQLGHSGNDQAGGDDDYALESFVHSNLVTIGASLRKS